ncbi:MAG: D-alanine--D-alanine ligase [Crocinitomicaceae bacterium]|nr:D-alanine--D-alanine ligase [Crocinitomicaceae bacterium]
MKNAGIICGGFSSEFEISVKSATNIYTNFPNGYKPYLILLKKTGWFVKLDTGGEIKMDSSNLTFDLEGKVQKIDFAIVYVHGDPGENGKIQSYLDMIDIPYVNSGPLASQLSFDKWFCNQFLKGFDFNVADAIYLTEAKQEVNVDQVIERLKLPIFVKPCDSGSSFGIAKVNNREELMPAIDSAFAEGETVVLEAFLDGVEVTCAAYKSVTGIETLPLTEIISKNDFFDYEAKYNGLSQEITPARISDDLSAKIQGITSKIYGLMQLRSIARVDYMIVNDEPFIIEVNTTPGFSNESIVPKMLGVSKLSVRDFWTQILEAEL